MLTVCYAAKGGCGTSTVAAIMALNAGDDALLVDLAGDAVDLLGIADEQRPGIFDWVRSAAEPSALANLLVAAGPSCRLIAPGNADPPTTVDCERDPPLAARLEAAWRWLRQRAAPTFVDAGSGDPPAALCAHADDVFLVTRTCYLALRHAHASAVRPTGVIVVREPGRSLHPRDVAAALDAPIVAEVPVDPAVARAADAGLLSTTVPRSVQRALKRTIGA